MHGACVFRRPRVVGGNLSVTDGGRRVPMSKSDVVRASGNQLFAMDQPGAAQPVGVAGLVDVMTVRGRKLPGCRTRARSGQGRHVRIIEVRMTPDLQLKVVEKCSFFYVQSENRNIRNQA